MNKYVATLTWVVGQAYDQQLLRFFLREVVKLSRKTLTYIKYQGGLIEVNGVEVTVRTVLRTNDRVTISLPAEKVSPSLVQEDLDLDIVYEDDHLLVINKQANMATIPSREHPNGTVANAVLGYYARKRIPATFHAVNRLDRETSGLMIVAKHQFAHDRISKLQQDGKVRRFYEAFIEGALQQKEGIIEAPIARDPASIIARCVSEDGQFARTFFTLKEKSERMSHVLVELETGRTHQIRVHFSHINHPLLGDDLYGGSKGMISRHALHCYKLEFIHPFTNEQKIITQPLPEDLRVLMND